MKYGEFEKLYEHCMSTAIFDQKTYKQANIKIYENMDTQEQDHKMVNWKKEAESTQKEKSCEMKLLTIPALILFDRHSFHISAQYYNQ